MKRNLILAGLGVLLLVVLYGVLLFKPAREEAAALRAETATLEQQQAQLDAELAKLVEIRRTAPELEAELITARAVVPEGSGVSAVVRQLQSAADEAGVTLSSLSPSRPQPVTPEGGTRSLARIPIAMDIDGSYFQVVDFLRRLEDPDISPRGFRFNSVTLSTSADEWPELQVTFQGEAFGMVEIAGVTPEAAPESDSPDGLGQNVDDGLDAVEGEHVEEPGETETENP